MKRLIAIAMMVLCLLTGFQQALIVMYFNLHQDAIEAAYCINKSRPALRCQATCFLKKTLDEVEHREAISSKGFPRMDMLLLSIWEFNAPVSSLEIAYRYAIYPEDHYAAPFLDVLVPPPIV